MLKRFNRKRKVVLFFLPHGVVATAAAVVVPAVKAIFDLVGTYVIVGLSGSRARSMQQSGT